MPNRTQKFRDLKPGNTGSQSMIDLTKLCQIVPKKRMARTRELKSPRSPFAHLVTRPERTRDQANHRFRGDLSLKTSRVPRL